MCGKIRDIITFCLVAYVMDVVSVLGEEWKALWRCCTLRL